MAGVAPVLRVQHSIHTREVVIGLVCVRAEVAGHVRTGVAGQGGLVSPAHNVQAGQSRQPTTHFSSPGTERLWRACCHWLKYRKLGAQTRILPSQAISLLLQGSHTLPQLLEQEKASRNSSSSSNGSDAKPQVHG